MQKSLLDYCTDSFLFGDDGRKSAISGTEQEISPALPVYDGDTNQTLLEKTLYPNNLAFNGLLSLRQTWCEQGSLHTF